MESKPAAVAATTTRYARPVRQRRSARSQSSRSRPLASCALVVVAVVAGVALAEVLLQSTGFGERNTMTAIASAIRSARAEIAETGQRPIFALWEPDPVLGWRCAPNAEVSTAHLDYYEAQTVRTNRFHMVDFEPDPRRWFVFVMGDSFVEGITVPREEHFTRQLEHGNSRYEFLNFGVSGYGSVQSYLNVHERMKLFSPSHVVYSIYFGNDFVENDPRTNTSMIGMRGYLRDTVPFLSSDDTVVYGADSFGPFDAWLNQSRAYLLFTRSLERAGLRASRGLGVAERVVQKLKNDLDEKGIPLSVLLIPDDASLAATRTPSYDRLRAHLRKIGVHTVSLLEPFRATGQGTMGYVDGRGQTVDGHWNAATHRLVAGVLGDELPLLAGIALGQHARVLETGESSGQ